jgi:hypothetical protein
MEISVWLEGGEQVLFEFANENATIENLRTEIDLWLKACKRPQVVLWMHVGTIKLGGNVRISTVLEKCKPPMVFAMLDCNKNKAPQEDPKTLWQAIKETNSRTQKKDTS